MSIGTWKEYVIFRNFHQGNQGELATLKWDCAFDDTSMESGTQSEYMSQEKYLVIGRVIAHLSFEKNIGTGLEFHL